MQARVSQRLDEGASGATFYPDAEIAAALNEAERCFCFLTLALEKTASWAVPSYIANGSSPFFHMLPVFPDWIVGLRISTASGAKVRPSRLEDLSAVDAGWWNYPAEPTRYVALGADLVALYGQPAAAITLNVTYARSPVALVNPTDAPEIPEEYHPELVNYGIYRLRQVEGGQEFEKALPLLASFLDAAQRYAAYVRARNIGSRYDTVPFELENFDRSKLLTLRPDLPPNRKAVA
jgi:hypothetical protein